jgi:hypothetical protein
MNEFGSNFSTHDYKFIGIHKIHHDLSLWRCITFIFNVCCIFLSPTLKWLKFESHKFGNFGFDKDMIFETFKDCQSK